MDEESNVKPVVSVCMITYKHENYIEQAVMSVISQQTNFSVEIVIGEDNSPDSTRKICERLAKTYTGSIKLLPSLGKNIGAQHNFIRTFSSCSGKYVAMLEGDDYWDDNQKLQKQVDFLENNKDYVIAFHDIVTISEKNELVDDNRFPPERRRDYERNELLLGEYLPTPAIVYRNAGIKEHLDLFKKTLNGDTLLQAILTQKGKAKYLNDIKAARIRVHNGGVWSSKGSLEKWVSTLQALLIIYKTLNKNLREYAFENFSKAFEMASWDADENNSKSYWMNYNWKYVRFLLMAPKAGKALLILRRIGNRQFMK